MKVIVSKPKNKSSILVVSESNPESAAIMLRSEVTTINPQGFIQSEKRVGWIKGKVNQLKALIAEYTLTDGTDFNSVVPNELKVKLVIKEALEPFYDNQEPKLNPQTKEPVTHSGALVYRQTLVLNESSSEMDDKLTTDRAEKVEKPKSAFAEEQDKK